MIDEALDPYADFERLKDDLDSILWHAIDYQRYLSNQFLRITRTCGPLRHIVKFLFFKPRLFCEQPRDGPVGFFLHL